MTKGGWMKVTGVLALTFSLCGCAQKQVEVGPCLSPAVSAPPATPVEVSAQAAGQVFPAEWCPPCPDNSWKVIVLHHSASNFGGAEVFGEWHRARGWEGLGYHFVIGNGTNTPDGCVEVGYRWNKQKNGAHTKSADGFYNYHGIGICVVGNFENYAPTPKQMESLRKLLAFLMNRYQITPDKIYGHREVKGNDTLCPGHYFPLTSLRYWLYTQDPIWASTAE